MVQTKLTDLQVFTLGLPEWVFQMVHLKSIHNCRSYGPDKFRWTDTNTHGRTHTWTHTVRCTHIHHTAVVTAIPHSSGLEKNMITYKFLKEKYKMYLYFTIAVSKDMCLTLSQTANFRLLQIERVCRRQFKI